MTTLNSPVSQAGQAEIARLRTCVRMYSRSIRYLEITGASFHELLRWYEKIEEAEATIRGIEDGTYDAVTKEVR